MKKRIKIVLALLALTIVSVVLLIALGLYTMEIEDTYGDNQDFYYKSRQGDIVINRDTKEFSRIEKTWKRIYGVHNADTADLWSWLEQNEVEIYRPVNSDVLIEGLKYRDLDSLIQEKKLELVIKK